MDRFGKRSPYVRFLVICVSLGLLVQLSIRLWQEAWWFPVGMDATTPEFATYWNRVGLLYLEFRYSAKVAQVGDHQRPGRQPRHQLGFLGWMAYRKPCQVCEAHPSQAGKPPHHGAFWPSMN